jgi:hypothetical protein
VAGRGSTKDKVRLILAWTSYGLGWLGGAAAVDTFIGSWTSGLLGIFPTWVALVAMVPAAGFQIRDIGMDWEPNRLALYGAIMTPLLAASIPTRLGEVITNACSDVLSYVDKSAGTWIGSSAYGLMFGCLTLAILISRRALPQGSGQGAGRGVPAGVGGR